MDHGESDCSGSNMVAWGHQRKHGGDGMAKNIVLRCGGTRKKLDIHRANLGRLFGLLKQDDPHVQVSWYDPAVRTLRATEQRP